MLSLQIFQNFSKSVIFSSARPIVLLLLNIVHYYLHCKGSSMNIVTDGEYTTPIKDSAIASSGSVTYWRTYSDEHL